MKPFTISISLFLLLAGGMCSSGGFAATAPEFGLALSAVPQNAMTSTSQPQHAEGGLRLPRGGETVDRVRAEIKQNMGLIKHLAAQIELSKNRGEKKTGRRTRIGPLQIMRDYGARVSLSRKDETEEYIVNTTVIWSYDHKDKVAHFIPAGTPIIGTFLQEALKLNLLLAVDEDTLHLEGSEKIDDEDCWVLEGKSPRKLNKVGVDSTVVRVWMGKKDGIPRKIQCPTEKNTVIYLVGVKVNAPMNADDFNFTPPKGVKTKNIFGF